MRMRWLTAVLLIAAGALLSAPGFSALVPRAAATQVLELEPDPETSCGDDNTGPCYSYLPLIGRVAPPLTDLPVGFNSGGWNFPLPDGRLFRRDQEYSFTTGAGYVGGSSVSSDFDWEPIEGVPNGTYADLYRRARSGLSAYHFDVPNGEYLVELHMAEVRRHGPQLRVFDVAIEGQTVLHGLDLHALAQHDYAVVFRFAAEVQDRQLEVAFSAPEGEPLLSAIWVNQRAADSQPTAAPATLYVLGGFRRAILRWPQVADDDVAGYLVYRSSSPDGPFQPVNAALTPLARFHDDTAAAGQSYCYAVSAVDVYGNEGPLSPVRCDTVVDSGASNLPVLHLSISLGNLLALAEDPAREVEVPGTLAVDGQHYSVTAEYRGQSTQFSNKKSWKLVADRKIPALGSAVLLLNSESYDPAMIREKLAYDLHEASGIQSQQSSFVHLTLNNEYIGVFTRIENPDRDFLLRTGRDAEDDVFKCRSDINTRPGCVNQVARGRGQAELLAFAALVNRTPDHEFAAALADVLDVRRFLDYQAALAVTADADSTYQYLLHRDQATGLWQVLPWDNNVTFLDAELPIDYGTSANPGWGDQVNTLLTRVLDVPQYRRYYAEQVLQLIDGQYSVPAMRARIQAIQQEILFDAKRDVWKAHRENNDAFVASLAHLPHFVAQRVAYLAPAASAYMPAQARFIGFNEVMARNGGTATPALRAGASIDPADGQPDPWFELVNVGLKPVDIGGMYLTDSLATPARFRIPPGVTLPPLGALLFWADGQPHQGPTHVNFTLAGAGGQIFLLDRDGATQIDAVTYGLLAEDVAWGRFPDYSGEWLALRHPTPGQLNRLQPPTISEVAISPRYPQAGDVVTVTATIADDGSVGAANLVYTAGGLTTTVPMFDDGNHGDGRANDGRYGAQLPTFPQHTVVTFYLSATDDYDRQALDPAAAPELTHRYRVGLADAPIVINEFMADNATTIEDPDEPGKYPDWIELANRGANPVNLNGFYLTDDLSRRAKFRISADVIVPPGGAVIFWADDDPQQGPLHTSFKLSNQGEAVGLFHRDGVTPVDTVEFGLQRQDVSYGRCWEQQGAWNFHFLPTPGQPNACGRHYLPLTLRQ